VAEAGAEGNGDEGGRMTDQVSSGPAGRHLGGNIQVIGIFPDEEECARAVRAVREAGFGKPQVYSPFPSAAIDEALASPKSFVRLFMLIGGISGAISGFALCIWLSAKWPHFTGGKPIVSLPPFVIIAFELMILFGELSGVLSFLVLGGFPRFETTSGHLSIFNEDRFGVVISCPSDQKERAQSLMLGAGAEEVKYEAL
jgi:hypothetical protein